MGQRRYPGAAPFTSKQANIFYGRDRDKRKLLTLIQIEKKVLLYSKSGLGKTSLLEAGVLPELVKKKYKPISIRLFAYNKDAKTFVSPLQRVVDALKKAVENLDKLPETILDKLSDDVPKDSLWYYFKKLQLAGLSGEMDSPPKVYLLVFDQFEELFDYPREQIDEFKNQFYELSKVRVPEVVTIALSKARKQNSELIDEDVLIDLSKEINVKSVFAIRSDKLNLLNRLSDKIRDIQDVFHEILPLEEDQARQAITQPAGDKRTEFDTRPFKLSTEAVNKIIDKLSDGGEQSIENTQLQIVCARIESIANDKPKEKINEDGLMPIEVEELPSFEDIFFNFYNDSINKIPEESQEKAKRFIEYQLIRNGRRISLDLEICKDHIDEEHLKELVKVHLLRSEKNSVGSDSYELSHDTLVDPILVSKKQHMLQKEREDREEELEQMRKEEKERKRKINNQRKWIIVGTVLLAIAIVAVFVAVYFMKQADKKVLEAKKSLVDLKNHQFKKYMEKGSDATGIADYSEAKRFYSRAIESIYYKDTTDNYQNPNDTINDTIRIYLKAFMESMAKLDTTGGDERLNDTTKVDTTGNDKNSNETKKVDIKKFIESVEKLSDEREDTIVKNLKEIYSLEKKINEYRTLKKLADDLYSERKYVEALDAYKVALEVDNNRYDSIKPFFNRCQRDARRVYKNESNFYKNEVDATLANKREKYIIDSLLYVADTIKLKKRP